MRTIILSTVTLFILSACSSEPTHELPTEQKAQSKQEATPVQKSPVSDKVESATQAKEAVAAINEKTEEISKVTEEVIVMTGADLYTQKCASCHGKDAKKSALNSSKSIAGWSIEQTEGALKGYKDGNYGGKMKAVMQGQSKPLSDADITLLAEYISVL